MKKIKNIFCLETEWTQSLNDLKQKPSALSVLDMLNNNGAIEGYSFRQVATSGDFEYYIEHLRHPSYDNFNVVYLCFHGTEKSIYFANGEELDLIEFARKPENRGIFKGRNVHFGSCSTLHMSKRDVEEFKKLTGARMMTGYKMPVDFMNSFVFELWLINAMCNSPHCTADTLMSMAKE